MAAFLWHGGLMAAAWLVLLPLGTLVARFYKVRPGQDWPRQLDDKWWWNWHRILQSAGAALSALAFWIVWQALDEQVDWAVPHVQLGLAVLGLCAAQLGSALLRGSKGGPTEKHADPADPWTWRGDHYDMTLRRRLFELWHKTLGYAALALAAAAAWTGIGLAGLPEWLKAGVGLAVLLFLVAFARLTRQGRRMDTWLAIWGPGGR